MKKRSVVSLMEVLKCQVGGVPLCSCLAPSITITCLTYQDDTSTGEGKSSENSNRNRRGEDVEREGCELWKRKYIKYIVFTGNKRPICL